MDEKYDDMLMAMAGQLGNIESMLNTFFSFLNRKTDLYVTWDSPTVNVTKPSMGFAAGKAEDLILKSFRSFPFKPYSVSSSKSRPTCNNLQQKYPSTLSVGSKENDAISPTTKSLESGGVGPDRKIVSSSVVLSKQKPVGNGGICPTFGYYWTQSLEEVTLYVNMPSGIRGRDIECNIQPKSLNVRLKKSDQKQLFGGDFPAVVKKEGSIWNLDVNSQILLVTLEKVVKTWWPSAFVGHPEIDTTKVDSRRNVEDFDEEAQAAIRKIMFDQNQKRLGLPTSDEIRTSNILESAKNAPGSPFLPEADTAENADGENISRVNLRLNYGYGEITKYLHFESGIRMSKFLAEYADCWGKSIRITKSTGSSKTYLCKDKDCGWFVKACRKRPPKGEIIRKTRACQVPNLHWYISKYFLEHGQNCLSIRKIRKRRQPKGYKNRGRPRKVHKQDDQEILLDSLNGVIESHHDSELSNSSILFQSSEV